jgi:hypothetical protein
MNKIKFSKSRGLTKTWMMLMAIVLIMGCATVGTDFPVEKVSGIEIGKTTQQEILLQFGSPWRVGIEDGRTTWTYGKYKYRIIGDTDTTDLVIRFDSQNIVASYSFNTTEHMQ